MNQMINHRTIFVELHAEPTVDAYFNKLMDWDDEEEYRNGDCVLPDVGVPSS